MRLPRSSHFETLLLAIAVATMLAFLSRGLGLCWDETIYFEYADGLRRWAQEGFSFNQAALEHAWHWKPFFNPHPPFPKILSALSSALVKGPFPLNYRLGPMVFYAGGLAIAFELLRRSFGRLTSLYAILLILAQPRLLAELLIATTDGIVALGWLLLALLSWQIAESRSQRKSLWVTLFIVHAIITASKITGFLAIVPVFLFHGFRHERRELALTALACVSSLTFLIFLSPYAWLEPWMPIWNFITAPLNRGHAISIATFYNGKIYGEQIPWHAFFVLSAITVPALTLTSAILSPMAWSIPKFKNLLLALLPFILVWIALGVSPQAPKHDGVRQFIAAFPLLGLLAWIGVSGLSSRLTPKHPLLLPLVPIAFGVIALWNIHPFEQSYFNALIGGLRGAEAANMEVSYDFSAFGSSALAWLNRDLPQNATITMKPAWTPLLLAYQAHGLLRADLRIPPEIDSQGDALLLFHRKSLVPEGVYQYVSPAFEVSHEGVSLLKIALRH